MNEYDLGACASCPGVQECLSQLAAIAALKELSVAVAMDPALDNEASQIYESFQGTGFLKVMESIEGVTIDNPADLINIVRKATADGLDGTDQHVEQEEEKFRTLTGNCDGPLKMRAKKLGRTITVTICNSPKIQDGHTHETAIVQRESKK